MVAPGGQRRVVIALLHVGLVEWIAILFLVALGAMLAATPAERGGGPYLLLVVAALLLLVAATAVYRRWFEGRTVPRFVFRLLIIGSIAVPYAFFQKIIPLIRPGEVDAALRAIDLWLVGGDAAVWLERFATPFSSAWFAACYFGYYVVMSLFLAGMLLFCRRSDVFAEFGVGILGCVVVALLVYNILPALGPYVYLADHFLAPLPEQQLVPFVHGFIQNGPLRDVFPSLHTGIPLAIFLFASRHFWPVAVVCGLWVPHIVVSTMFLRYHYLVDVLAGALLAIIWFLSIRPLIRWHQRLRRRWNVRAEP